VQVVHEFRAVQGRHLLLTEQLVVNKNLVIFGIEKCHRSGNGGGQNPYLLQKNALVLLAALLDEEGKTRALKKANWIAMF
jgi:hypothetical protein